MIEAIYGQIEGRVLRWETARRGRNHAARAERDPDAITDLAAVPARIGDAAVVSFDLFDTVMHRRLLAPEAITRKTAGFARLIAGARAGEVIFAARHALHAQMKADMIRAGTGDEPPLAVLFEAALRHAGVPRAADLADRLVAFETPLEVRGMAAAPGAAAMLTRLRSDGRLVIATSDMYLPEGSMRAILAAIGLGDAFDHVFVSSTEGWTKKSGRLYGIVADRIGIAPDQIVHVGDRMDSDVRPARAAGWRALHYLNRAEVAAAEAERIAESHVPSPALRRDRISAALDCASPSALPSVDDIIATLIGPACGLLALRALGHAGRIGAKHLFHLTRDATLIGEIAVAARAAHPHLVPGEVNIAELAISRAQGALLAIRHPGDLAALAHLVPYLTGQAPSAPALMKAFGLPDTAFTDPIRGAAGPAFMALLDDVAHAAPLLAALDEKRGAVEAYLAGTGILDAARAVVVDIGYSGTFGAQLSHLLHAVPAEGRRIECLFLATSRYLNGNLRQVHPQVRLHPGVALDHRWRSARAASRTFAWLEPFLVDPARGRLLGYATDTEQPVPRFDDPGHSPDRVRDLDRMRDAIRARAARFINDFHGAPGDAEEVAALLQRRLARLAAQPHGSEVRAIAALHHQSGQSALAVRAPVRRVNLLRLRSELAALQAEDYWVQGSLRLSGLGPLNRAFADAPERDRRADPRLKWD